MGGTARVWWTRGTTAANSRAGLFHFTPELQVQSFFCEVLGSLIRSKPSLGFSRILSELVMCSSLAVFHLAKGASGLDFFPQSLASFFLRSLHQSCPLQHSVCCPCPAKHTSGCRNTPCVRMWPWARALLSLPSNPVFLKTSSEHPACESRWEGRGLTGCLRFQAGSGKLHPALAFLLGQGWDLASPGSAPGDRDTVPGGDRPCHLPSPTPAVTAPPQGLSTTLS